MTDRRARERGVALLLTVGILVLLSLAAAAMLSVSVQLRAAGSAVLERATARLLARSGIEYAGSRLFQDPSPKVPATSENQSDDWTCREGWDTPLEKTLNPSYAQTEPYRDLGNDGRFNAADAYSDRNGNGRFDAWSGRLRGRSGILGATFVLEILSEGSKLPVNQGLLDALDRNGNGIPDCRDGGGTHFDGGVFFWQTTDYPDEITQLNRRLPDLISTLWQILTVRKQLDGASDAAADLLLDQNPPPGPPNSGPGKAILDGRPLGGYRSLSELQSRLSQQDWGILKDYLSLEGERPMTFGIIPYSTTYPSSVSLVSETRSLIRFTAASRPLLQALQVGILRGIDDIATSHDFTRAGGIADHWLRHEPYKSWYEWYLDLEAYRRDVSHNVEFIMPPVIIGTLPQKVNIPTFPTTFVDILFANASPDQVGVRNGVNVFPPYSWINYDLDRDDDGKRDLQSYSVSRFWTRKTSLARSYRVNAFSSSSAPYGTMEMDLSPHLAGGGYSVESLGRSGGGGGRFLSSCKMRSVVTTAQAVSAYSQADFEHAEAPRVGQGVLILGRPVKDRIQSFPMFPLESMPEMASDPDYHYTLYAGDLRLMDYSSGPSGTSGEVFYAPAWEVGQPFRVPAAPERFEENFSDVVGSGVLSIKEATWFPESMGAKDVLLCGRTLYGEGDNPYPVCCSMSHGPGFLYPGLYVWGAGGTSLGDFPMMDRASGTVPQGTIEFWTAGSNNFQANPMRSGLTINFMDSYMGVHHDFCWFQFDTMVAAKTYEKGGEDGNADYGGGWEFAADRPGGMAFRDWWHVVIRIGGNVVTLYVDGISLGMGQYEVYALDPSWKQEWMCVPGLASLSGTGNAGGFNCGQDELRMCRSPLPPQVIAAHASQARFWVARPELDPAEDAAHDLRRVPSFTSPLYVFTRHSILAGARWDGYVPKLVWDATEAWNSGIGSSQGKVPLKVELLLYQDPLGNDKPRILALDEEHWKTGGGWTSFKGEGCMALRYRVSMDVSAVNGFNNETPVFDSISIHYRTRKLLSLAEE